MGTTGKATFSLLFGCQEIPIPIGQLDHLHAKGCSQLLLGSGKHPLELAALRPKDWKSERVSLAPMSQRCGGVGVPFSLMPSLRIGVREYSQAKAYRTIFLISSLVGFRSLPPMVSSPSSSMLVWFCSSSSDSSAAWWCFCQFKSRDFEFVLESWGRSYLLSAAL